MARRSRGAAAVLVFVYVLLVAAPAHAYVDPGTGSYVFQLIIGALLGAGVAIKMYWKRNWLSLTRRGSRERAAAEGDAATPLE